MIETLGQILLTYPEAGYAVTFVAAFLESLAFIGVLFPGTIVVVVAGFVAEQIPNALDVRGVLVMAGLGVYLGSLTSYLLGRYYGPPMFTAKGFFAKRGYLLVRTQEYFARRRFQQSVCAPGHNV